MSYFERTLTGLVWFVTLLPLFSCIERGEVTSSTSGLVFANPGPRCASSPAGLHKLPADVDFIVARVLSSDGVVAKATITAKDLLKNNYQLLMTGIPPGVYSLEVVGCHEQEGGLTATWRGINPHVEVWEDTKSAPVIFMLPAGRLACVGGRNLNPLTPSFEGDGFLVEGRSAFAAGAVTPGGKIFIAGGGGSQDFKTSPDRLRAGNGLWEFNLYAGVFQKITSPIGNRVTLGEPRLMHGLIALSEDRLLVFGGAAELELGPKGFPGNMPPMLPVSPVKNTAEVISLDDGTVSVASKLPDAGMAPAWAFDKKRKVVALAGGTLTGSATPSDRVLLFIAESAIVGENPEFRYGTLSTPRMGGAAVFLSSGELLLVGGWDGSKASPLEVVSVSGKDLNVSVIEPNWEGDAPNPTAFPSVALLSDDGVTANILVLGGNPLSPGFGYRSPDGANGWILMLSYSSGKVDVTKANARRIEITDDFATRSLASLVPFGGSHLLVGGYRSFASIDVEDCRNSNGNPLPYCFPRSIAAFVLDGTSVSDVEIVSTPTGRLGAAVVPLDSNGDMVMVIGGLAGMGGQEPLDWTEPYDWKTPSDWILSTGVIAVRQGLFDASICEENRPGQ